MEANRLIKLFPPWIIFTMARLSTDSSVKGIEFVVFVGFVVFIEFIFSMA